LAMASLQCAHWFPRPRSFSHAHAMGTPSIEPHVIERAYQAHNDLASALLATLGGRPVGAMWHTETGQAARTVGLVEGARACQH